MTRCQGSLPPGNGHSEGETSPAGKEQGWGDLGLFRSLEGPADRQETDGSARKETLQARGCGQSNLNLAIRLRQWGGAVSHQSRADHVLRRVPPHPPKSRCMFGGGQDGLGPKSLEPKAVLGLEVWCPRLGQE